MKGYTLLKTVCRMILPFVILYGLYIIVNGDLSPGGGFQGGVVLASCYIILFFIKDESVIHFSEIIRYEKWLFLLLVMIGALHLLAWNPLMDILSTSVRAFVMPLSLMVFNIIIGVKVTFGLWSILIIFTEEGEVS